MVKIFQHDPGGGVRSNKFCAQSQIKKAKIRKIIQTKNISKNDSKIDREITVFLKCALSVF